MQDEGEAQNSNPAPLREPPPPPADDEEDEEALQCEDDDDAVKTFCTEGTPAYTPYQIGSRATSLSDLRDLDHQDHNGQEEESPPEKGIMFGAAAAAAIHHKKMKVSKLLIFS